MLAVQQVPAMGSEKPPEDDFLPFGYSIDPNEENPIEPPEPAPGAPLLSDSDNRFLDSFFNDITTDQYNMPSFGEGLNFSDAWLDLPPQFMGSTTSFGQHHETPLQSPSLQQQGTPLASPGLQQQHGATLASAGLQGMNSLPTDFSRSAAESQLMPPPPPPPSNVIPQHHHQQTLQQQHVHQRQHQNQHQQQHQHYQLHQQSPHQQQAQLPLQLQLQLGAHSHQRHSDEVLSAAATLLHNNPTNHNRHTGPDSNLSQNHAAESVGQLRHQGLAEFHEDKGPRSVAQDQQQHQGFPAWAYQGQAGPSHPSHPRQGQVQDRSPSRPGPPTDFQWGSDSNFSAVQAYTPDTNRETVDSMHQTQLDWMKCLSVSKSAASTRPSSPSQAQNDPPPDHQQRKLSHQPKAREDPNAPPRKRRKSKNNKESMENNDEEEEEVDAGKNTTKAPRRRKSKAEMAAVEPMTAAEPASGGKRRKSTANGAKPPRENLSEEQKRENHIKSEQKRRTLIKDGYQNLCDLVPELKGGGYSKSSMLTISAEWLEDLLQGNKTLQNQLDTLGR